MGVAARIAVVGAIWGLSGCAISPHVIRLEYVAAGRRTNPYAETGVIYLGVGKKIQPSMLTPKTRAVVLATFPMEDLYAGRLANTCFVNDHDQGFAVLDLKRGRVIEGSLWRVADAGHDVTIELKPNGSFDGTLREWYATLGGDTKLALTGSYRIVSGFDECLRKISARQS